MYAFAFFQLIGVTELVLDILLGISVKNTHWNDEIVY